MELGLRLRQARLEAGLSQRQLCGDKITRNMLSQIENGSAKPSMETLQYLASRLQKPLGFFLKEAAMLSPNQAAMEQARKAYAAGDWEAALAAVEDFREPDECAGEKWLLEGLCCLSLAEDAIKSGKTGYGESLLQRAAVCGEKTPYLPETLQYRRLLLECRLRPEMAGELACQLPSIDAHLQLLAQADLQKQDPKRAAQRLYATQEQTEAWHFWMAESLYQAGELQKAAEEYRLSETAYPIPAATRLEQCYRGLEDYKQAYFYACRLREYGVSP